MQPFIASNLSTITSTAFWAILALGLCIGSFLNVCIFRIPEGTFFKHRRSVCRNCEAPIPWWWNLPILSFVLARGKARCCGSPISIQYPAVEFLTALVFAGFYLKFPFLQSLSTWHSADQQDALRFGHAALFSSLLIVCSFIDLRHRIIPDMISLPMIGATPIVIYLHPDLSWKSGLIGVIAGAGVIYGVAWLYYLARRQEGIGMGDAKLLAAIGGWLGYQAVAPTILIGSVSGSLVGIGVMVVTKNFSGKLELPFGPFLVTGALTHLAWGPALWNWWIGG